MFAKYKMQAGNPEQATSAMPEINNDASFIMLKSQWQSLIVRNVGFPSALRGLSAAALMLQNILILGKLAAGLQNDTCPKSCGGKGLLQLI